MQRRPQTTPETPAQATADRTLVMILDRTLVAASRRQLVAWSNRCARRKGLGFITGVHVRTVQSISRGLKATIYNAGASELLSVTELLGWMDWRALVLIENGCCWEVPVGKLRDMTRAPTGGTGGGGADPAQDDIYARTGLIYQDR